jgi:phage terminase large subunit-like protein
VAKYPNRPYAQWRNAGILEITEGNTTDYDLVERAVLEDCQRDGIREVAYDKRFAEQMAQHLVGAGIAMVDQPQGEWLHEAITRKLELITRGLLCHGDNPILTWMASNYVLRQNSNTQRFRPDKDKAGEKIDGQVALDMAIARWVRMPVEHPVEVLAEWL